MSEAIERAFRETTKILFGKGLKDMENYEKWLMRYLVKVITSKSRLSDIIVKYPDIKSWKFEGAEFFKKTYVVAYENFISLNEIEEYKKNHISLEKLEDINLSNAVQKVKDIKYIGFNPRIGPEVDLEDVVFYYYSSHCSHGMFYVQNKYCSYSHFPKRSEYVFGCAIVLDSKFCINCYESSKLTRCFEVAESTNCRDCYFCYNCENLDNCMFCSNATSKRYAIANIEVGKEEYLKFKKKILEEITQKLEKDKTIKWDIYNIGCAKVKK